MTKYFDQVTFDIKISFMFTHAPHFNEFKGHNGHLQHTIMRKNDLKNN